MPGDTHLWRHLQGARREPRESELRPSACRFRAGHGWTGKKIRSRSSSRTGSGPRTSISPLWHYTIDPLILAVSAKTWATLNPHDLDVVRQAGSLVMELQKEEARDAPLESAKMVELLRDMYGMEVLQLLAGRT